MQECKPWRRYEVCEEGAAVKGQHLFSLLLHLLWKHKALNSRVVARKDCRYLPKITS